jgi:hypothetical protein
MRPRPAAPASRSGVILLVVVSLLTLFALVSISFVLYADAAAVAARLFRESQVPDRPDQDAETLLSYFLGQLLYDVKDDAGGVSSSLRGHSLARLLYGYNEANSNATPFNGTGRLHAPSRFPDIDDYSLVNYTYFPGDRFLRDPERLGWRADLMQARGLFTGGANVPYTYPDLNNMFLAAVKADGTLLLPSYHRPWTGFGSLDPANPNWYDRSSPWLKYQVLRPRPADMPGFPAPTDTGGDVKNLLGAPGGNDSIWLDLGYPVQIAAAGRKYKPLFAPLIMDLDNRLNVNVHGNVRGGDSGRALHLSQQGLGPWEVNLQYVLDQARPEGPEWPGLLLGSTTPPQRGRYGPASPERSQPWLYNVFQPAGNDRVFALSNMEALLRYGDTGSPALTSELFRLCPTNFAETRARHLVTTRSTDFDQPGASPWIYDPSQYPYQMTADAEQAPAGPPIPFPVLTLRSQPVPAESEFSAPGLPPSSPAVDWRALSAAIARVDLNRPLTPYPTTTSARFDVSLPLADQFQRATQDRQRLANEIYDRLLRATGVPRSGHVPNQPTPEELQVRRWLAQLAVNIVDFVDEDDIQTPFNFYTVQDAQGLPFDPGALSPSGVPAVADPELPRYWVFGTELPPVVLNEVLAESEELSPATSGAPVRTRVKVWVELHCPTPSPLSPEPPRIQDVLLKMDAVSNSVVGKNAFYAPYQVCLATGILPRPLGDNVLGQPSTVRSATRDADFAPPGPSPSVPAQGFLVLGPPGHDAHNTLTASLPSVSLQYVAPQQAEEREAGLTVVLRRLANPHIPFDPRPGILDQNGEGEANPWYNPYVTIDYLQNIPLRNASSPVPYASRGKRQPYASHPSQVADQIAPRTQAMQHTFGLPNNPLPLRGQPDWLVHLDRPLISPMELLHVAGCQPHQLTQRFVVGDDRDLLQKFRHYAPWFDQTRRLYRFFELVETHSLAAGVSPGGRIPGKINLNTVWEPEIFLALCDPQPSNGPTFTRTNVQAMFQQLLQLRTPNLLATGGGLSPGDRPFLSLATGYALPQTAANPDPQHPRRGSGINDTLLRAAQPDADLLAGGGAATPRLFQLPDTEHPYWQGELLTKIFNQVTTRSNVFAVWLTVGFFEVTDDSARPAQLGAEVGRAENRQVRHRLFAIVDRSLMDGNPGPAANFKLRSDAAVAYFSVID